MKKVLVFEPIAHSACAFYRSRGVFEYLKSDRVRFDLWDLSPYNELKQYHLYGYDAVYFGRPYEPVAVQFAEAVKDLGIKLILDYDDDLFNLEPDNERAHPVYSHPDTTASVRKLLNMSDLCLVTTEGLAENYRNAGAKKVVVIPNAFNDSIFDIDARVPSEKRIIFWRGGESHRLEIQEFAPEIIKVVKKYPAWKMITMGFKDHSLVRKLGPQIHHENGRELIPYFHSLYRKIHPSIAIIPLRDNVFNVSKSNIAWQEATFAGAVSVHPTTYQWRDCPGHRYDSIEDFADKMEKAIVTFEEDRETHLQTWRDSVQKIKNEYLLSTHNKTREQAIYEVIA